LPQAIADACRVPSTSISELTESDLLSESEKTLDEDEELEQLINGEVCFKMYPFSNGIDSGCVLRN